MKTTNLAYRLACSAVSGFQPGANVELLWRIARCKRVGCWWPHIGNCHLEEAARKRREKMIGNAGAPSRLPKHRHLAPISSERANIFLHFGCNQSRCGCVYKNRVNFSHKLEQLVPINIGEALTWTQVSAISWSRSPVLPGTWFTFLFVEAIDGCTDDDANFEFEKAPPNVPTEKSTCSFPRLRKPRGPSR